MVAVRFAIGRPVAPTSPVILTVSGFRISKEARVNRIDRLAGS
jgi:hypothetical protein